MKYKVLKDYIERLGALVKAGETVSASHLEVDRFAQGLLRNGFLKEIKDEPWKPKEGDVFYAIENPHGQIVKHTAEAGFNWWGDYEELGDYFQTKEQAEKAVAWLKAFKVLRDDTKGFKPIWNDNKYKFFVAYTHDTGELLPYANRFLQDSNIYFATEADAKESIKNHKKEWLIFLGVESE